MIRFSKYIWLYAFISGIVVIPGIISLLLWGLRPAVDFTGGTLVELRVEPQITQAILENQAKTINLEFSAIQKSADGSYLLRMKKEEDAKVASLTALLTRDATNAAIVLRQETVGPVLGKELLTKTLSAAVVAVLAILLYIAYAFKSITYGVAAVVALLHDLLVILGTYSLLGHFFAVEVDTLFVTAFLTTMSFSVHDTIVVFDRIREYLRKDSRHSFEEVSDIALTETMGRSLTNSFTILFMLLALVLMGGSTTQWFVTALLIGTVSGTYSSPFVATPVLILWERWKKKR